MQSLTPRKERHVDFRVQSLDKLNQEDFNTEAKSRNRVNKTTVLSPASDTHKNTCPNAYCDPQAVSAEGRALRQRTTSTAKWIQGILSNRSFQHLSETRVQVQSNRIKNTLHRRHASLQPLSLFSNHSRQLEAS